MRRHAQKRPLIIATAQHTRNIHQGFQDSPYGGAMQASADA
jgi:hypothetical protein